MRRNCMQRSMISLKNRQNKGWPINRKRTKICMIPPKADRVNVSKLLKGDFMYIKLYSVNEKSKEKTKKSLIFTKLTNLYVMIE